MQQCKLISKQEDLEGAVKVDWDVKMNGHTYDVYRIEGFPHSIGGRWGENCYYALERGEEWDVDNFISFSGHPVCWGYRIEQKNSVKVKWGEARMNDRCWGVITRNGEDFYETGGSMEYLSHYLPHLIIIIQEQVPINFGSRKFKSELLGRRVKYDGIPGVIESYIEGQCCVMVKLEGDHKYAEDGEIKVDIIEDRHIDWFPDSED